MQHIFFLYTSCGESWVVDPKASWNSSFFTSFDCCMITETVPTEFNISISKTNIPCILLEDIDFFVVSEIEFHLIS